MTVVYYDSFHTNPINKFIHFIFIPLIMISTLNLLKNIKGDYDKKITMFYVVYYYLVGGVVIGFVMNIFIVLIYAMAGFWRGIDKNWFRKSIYLFTFSWIMQFIGHFIEGNKPAFITGLVHTVFEAPLYVINYIYPRFLEK